MSEIDVFVIAGEPSGDLHGAKLISSLLLRIPSLQVAAVSGPHMRKLPIQSLFSMENLSVMGFIDVFFAIPKIMRQFFVIRKKILQMNPKVVIFIDYPGFNLRIQKSLRKKGYQGKLIHYICPSVWAWGKKRIPMMAETLDLLFTFFPFEKECFAKTSLKVEHIGHPLVQFIHPPIEKRTQTIAIFPGSRTKEIERNLPIQIAVARSLQKEDPNLDIVISVSHPDKLPLIRSIAMDIPLVLDSYSLMKTAKLALATSGTVTLELALHETPTIVNFMIRPLDLFLAQKVFKINLPFYCIVNIIAGYEIFPEFFGPNCTQGNIFQAAKDLMIRNPDFKKVRSLLTNKNASEEAVSLIVPFLSGEKSGSEPKEQEKFQ
ncbi:MAG TPA: lipid-A-disaccharide synthase [Chlamydiales bacterium]|nr:lipid-A-disaccharide synthase [Chlamydiales bacterium]